MLLEQVMGNTDSLVSSKNMNDVRFLANVISEQYYKSFEIYSNFYNDVLTSHIEKEANIDIWQKSQISFELYQICNKFATSKRRSKKLKTSLIEKLEEAKKLDVVIY